MKSFKMVVDSPMGKSEQRFTLSSLQPDDEGKLRLTYFASQRGDVVVDCEGSRYPIGGWNHEHGSWEWIDGGGAVTTPAPVKVERLFRRVVENTPTPQPITLG